MPTRTGREGLESGQERFGTTRSRSGGEPVRTPSGSDNQGATGGKNPGTQNDTSSRSEREDLSSNDNSDHDPYNLDRDTNLDPVSSGGSSEGAGGAGPSPDAPAGKSLDEIAAELEQERKESLAEYQARVEAWNQKVWGEALSLSQSPG
jgi:hypothetical protein